MSASLFVFTIAPVQSFIAQARKTQDLFGGSQLLSDLIKQAVEHLPPGSELLFPDRDIRVYPNRFLAIIPNGTGENIGQNVEGAVKKLVKETFDNTCSRLKLFIPAKAYDKCLNQLKNFLQISWVLMPFDDSAYADKYTKIDSLMKAVKNSRSFNQLEGETGGKCHICGERDFIFCRQGNEKAKKVKDKVEFNTDQIEKTEGLCAVCFTKRFNEKKPFPSTADIALKHILESDTFKEHIEGYKQHFNLPSDRYFNAQLYYEENLTEQYFDKNDLAGEILPVIRAKQKELAKFVKENNSKLNKYYALIILDADDLGKWLSGEFLERKDNLEAFHGNLSKKLGGYAQTVKQYFEQKKTSGNLVYHGGDDMLAFVNLNHLLPVVKNLTKSDKLPSFEGIKAGAKFSISGGIVIAHYKTPLSEVLSGARKLLEEAKQVKDKDAFGMALIPHSGNMVKMVAKWKYFDLIDDFLKVQSQFSDKFVFSFKQEMLPVFEGSNWEYGDLEYVYNLTITELSRLMLRAKKENISKEDAPKKIKDIVGGNRFREFINFNLEDVASDYRLNIHNLSALLEIARFLYKEIQEEIA